MVNQSDAVLIVGYDANNIVYYDPAAGKNVSKPLEEAQAMFSEAGIHSLPISSKGEKFSVSFSSAVI